MNNKIITSNDMQIVLQQNKIIHYKIELLNSNLTVLNLLQGNLISDNLTINADSDIRRTYTCDLVVTDSTFTISRNTNIWYDKRIKPYIGITHERSGEIIWYCLGIFLFTDTNYSYDAQTHELSLTCLDMMCLLNDNRGGQLDSYQRTIQEGSDVRSVIISLLQEVGINKYYIEFSINGKLYDTFKLPYDKTYDASTTAYTIISELITLYPGTQQYFDIDGTYIICSIPTNKNERNVLTNDILQQILISESTSFSFSDLYNAIEIWGTIFEPDYYSTEVTTNGSNYNVTVFKDMTEPNQINWETYSGYINYDKFAIKIPSTNLADPTININNLGQYAIIDETYQPIQKGLLQPNTDYVFRYLQDVNGDNKFMYMGQYQCYGKAYLTNNIYDTSKYAVIDQFSDLSIEKIGTVLKVLSGSNYEDIYTDGLCEQRCRYELYNSINKQETLDLDIIAVPWLDVNQKISFKSKETNEVAEYLINNISVDYSQFTMSLTTSRFYPEYIEREDL